MGRLSLISGGSGGGSVVTQCERCLLHESSSVSRSNKLRGILYSLLLVREVENQFKKWLIISSYAKTELP